jgi:hypothetical protein
MPALQTPQGMLSFPHLFVPKPRAKGGEPVFSLSLVLDENAQKSPEYAALKKAVLEAIEDKWPGKAKDEKFVRALRLPFRKAEEKEYAGYDKGKIFISAWTKTKPGLVDGQRQDISAPSDVWAGQVARATVAPFAYENSGNRGVSFMLNNVQITKANMPRMDGRKSAQEDFEDVSDEAAVDYESPF